MSRPGILYPPTAFPMGSNEQQSQARLVLSEEIREEFFITDDELEHIEA